MFKVIVNGTEYGSYASKKEADQEADEIYNSYIEYGEDDYDIDVSVVEDCSK